MLCKWLRFIGLATFIGVCSFLPKGYAEEAAAPTGLSEQTLSRFARLKQLKEQNPEEFQRIVQERKSQIKSRFDEYRQASPEQFENLKGRVVEKRRHRLERMKNENPEKFRQVMGERREKFEKMRAENPERAKRFMEKHPRFEERMNRMQEFRSGERRGASQNAGLQNPRVRELKNRGPQNSGGLQQAGRQGGPQPQQFRQQGAVQGAGAQGLSPRPGAQGMRGKGPAENSQGFQRGPVQNAGPQPFGKPGVNRGAPQVNRQGPGSSNQQFRPQQGSFQGRQAGRGNGSPRRDRR